jgi:hypothetical protein
LNKIPELKSELYKALKAIDCKLLTDDDNEELLNLFRVTESILIRNKIALMFADAGYDKAIPHLIEKINDRNTYNKNGTLVFALGELNSQAYFIDIVKIICEQGYEARMTAYGIVCNYVSSTPDAIRKQALVLLNDQYKRLVAAADDNSDGSRLHYIEGTIDLLK